MEVYYVGEPKFNLAEPSWVVNSLRSIPPSVAQCVFIVDIITYIRKTEASLRCRIRHFACSA